MMRNYVANLRNYQRFGRFVRTWTATGYLKLYDNAQNDELRKTYAIRMYEETIASTEDLLMWVYVTLTRTRLLYSQKDIWLGMLKCDIDNPKTLNEIKPLSRLSRPSSLLKKLKLPNMDMIATVTNSNAQVIELVLESLLKAIKASTRNRVIGNKVLLLGQNKIKHGMLVLETQSHIQITAMPIGKRKYRQRNLVVQYDSENMHKMFKTIEHNGAAISLLITALLSDFYAQVKNKKGKFGKRQLQFLKDATQPLFIDDSSSNNKV